MTNHTQSKIYMISDKRILAS